MEINSVVRNKDSGTFWTLIKESQVQALHWGLGNLHPDVPVNSMLAYTSWIVGLRLYLFDTQIEKGEREQEKQEKMSVSKPYLLSAKHHQLHRDGDPVWGVHPLYPWTQWGLVMSRWFRYEVPIKGCESVFLDNDLKWKKLWKQKKGMLSQLGLCCLYFA